MCFEFEDNFRILYSFILRLFYCLIYFPLFLRFCACRCFGIHYFASFLVLHHLEKEVVLLLLSYGCLAAVNVLWLFLTAPWVGLHCVVVVFPYHTHLFFIGHSVPFCASHPISLHRKGLLQGTEINTGVCPRLEFDNIMFIICLWYDLYIYGAFQFLCNPIANL